ncbi:GGDEF domain-containing response regulator [Desulfuribacillus alkaliarsenatis]|uniref:Diguanylate cyclase response regulator n=1 Tax=Desulfuribacillus alkaliarsenatis TaxID=766136 RepID=A0A1E5G6E5_9FIRM|nr:diguanylate cyclase [Desulfuribacillus alkaliarsenatis]OEF98665.1 hypothetical protein BHF68_03120 [Desulfuribacillus alkaliarsenatis]
MSILIVDDSTLARAVLSDILMGNGYDDIVMKSSAKEAIEYILKNSCGSPSDVSIEVDLILMDGIMPEIEGIEACRLIRNIEGMADIPIIMVTGKTDIKTLQDAFDAGANDYITKPFNKLELLARVRAALNLKYEIDKRKDRERELKELNKILQELSSIDGLTGVANRRRFDETLEIEFKRAVRNNKKLSIIMADIDFFKEYNDTYGHQAGDDCLKKIASVLNDIVKRPGDLVARYGGEEFVVILPDTDEQGAKNIALLAKNNVENLKIPHEKSRVGEHVTISLGVSTLTEDIATRHQLLKEADIALYESKKSGRNCVHVYSANSNTPGHCDAKIIRLSEKQLEKKHKVD